MRAHWKTDIEDLRGQARAVLTAPPSSSGAMSARTAAACLSGIVGMVSRRWSVDIMQRVCADLARHVVAQGGFGQLPAGHDGVVSEPIQLIAVVSRSLLVLAGAENLRAALAFWASEDDPAVWNQVAA